jgi:hypothetical protein
MHAVMLISACRSCFWGLAFLLLIAAIQPEPNHTVLELHLVAGQRASLIAEDVLHLPQLLVDRRRLN